MKVDHVKTKGDKQHTHRTEELAAQILTNQYTLLQVYVTTIQVSLGHLEEAEQTLRRYLIQPDQLKIDYTLTK